MRVIRARNVHRALPFGVRMLSDEAHLEQTRNGRALVMDAPVCTIYERPIERVLFWEERDANPFFHLAEALWMLAGRRDVQLPSFFAKQIAEYSDDGTTLHGAYGHRWRQHFHFDQLDAVIKELQLNLSSRRVVLQMWSAQDDLARDGKDLPCNTHVYFRCQHSGHLDMTVLNRSNDMVWGAYGANAVHFSFLQEYVARAIGVRVGYYYQFSNNFHAYLKTFEPLYYLGRGELVMHPCPYEQNMVKPSPLTFTDRAEFDRRLEEFLDSMGELAVGDEFLDHGAGPLFRSYWAYKSKDYDTADRIVCHSTALDWREACRQWLNRRRAKRAEKESAK